jgi:anhydro-N-acetylmuramic acid kinase
MSELYIGLISGTSIDGVDAVLAEIDDATCRIRQAATTPFPPVLLERLRRIVETTRTSLLELGALDCAVGRFFATCAVDLIERAGVTAAQITAIGHHGQTIYHHPVGDEPFSMQIGDPNVIAAVTGAPTVADFRRLDMAHGGQGAPLVPAFHAWCFRHAVEARVVVNIGGIANITVLAPVRAAIGFDTGPGNTLLDLWIRRCRGDAYDSDGQWAASGRVHEALLTSFLSEPFFATAPPKSTGRELFNMAWIDHHLLKFSQLEPADVQATLAELTAATIVAAADASLPSWRRLIVCGGGAHNSDLMTRLRRRTSADVATTDSYGIQADWVEGAAFAWLARARLRAIAGNVPSVTGARRPAVLGGVYWGTAS